MTALTGTGDGRLFAFEPGTTRGPYVDQVDTMTGNVTTQYLLPAGTQTRGTAFVFWGGYFYVFAPATAGTAVSKYDPVSQTSVPVTTIPNVMVLTAGDSTCAPL